MSGPFHVRRIRLLNFHNLVDETLPVRKNLFLIGDNQSGKTTVLDAVHFALTAGVEMELNAAARLRSLRRRTGLAVEPWRMDLPTFERFQEAGLPLPDGERAEIVSLIAASPDEISVDLLGAIGTPDVGSSRRRWRRSCSARGGRVPRQPPARFDRKPRMVLQRHLA